MSKRVVFGRLVRSRRKQKNLTIEQLAELCNCSSKTINNIELRKSIPKTETFIALCTLLRINTSNLNRFKF